MTTKLKYPQWQQAYEAVLLEFDPDRLRELVAALESAVFVRLHAAKPVGSEERQAIDDATCALYTIKRDILKFPGLNFDSPAADREVFGLD